MKRPRPIPLISIAALVLLTVGCPPSPPGPTEPTVAEAEGAMARAKGQPIPVLLGMLKERDSHGSASFAAISELSGRGPGAVPELVAGLRSPDEEVRTGCASALGAMRNPRPKSAVPQLVEALSDAESRTRGQAAWALGEIGVADDSAIAALTSLASATNPQFSNTTREAKEALEKIRGSRPKANPD